MISFFLFLPHFKFVCGAMEFVFLRSQTDPEKLPVIRAEF
jgi:hypothetical protein